MSNRINITIRPIVPKDARQIAVLHISGIGTGFISSLGVDGVTRKLVEDAKAGVFAKPENPKEFDEQRVCRIVAGTYKGLSDRTL